MSRFAAPLAPKAWVFAGGDFSRAHLPVPGPREGDHIVCVDKGLEYCLAAGLVPTVMIGDFDSVDAQLLDQAELAHIPRHTYPLQKNASDLELALDLLTQERLSEVVILGVSGGRTDHMLFNWSLPALRVWPFRLILIDGTTHCFVLQGRDECLFAASRGQTLSLLAKTHATGLSTAGLEYPLREASLDVGSTLGLSNVVQSEVVKVCISSGTLLVMINAAF